ncbi:hypothetical protein AB4124_23565 [Paenibacillus sp. 2KB_20]|uniref:hypothetical protein n=1 Tax=Paenibacillus sp. 2KB_20 TaxID=3232977 RepID=UPI003F99760A
MNRNILEYDPLGTKESIRLFIEMYNMDISISGNNKLKCVIKKIIFIKLFVDNHNPTHYPKSMIFDILSALNSLKEHKQRYYHFNIRSFIENILRTILLLDDSDRTGVNELFRQSRSACNEKDEEIEIINLLESKYTISNNYVHSNLMAGIEIHQFYKKIKEETMQSEITEDCFDQMCVLLTRVSELLIRRFSNEVEHIFFRKKATLSFLLNDELSRLQAEKQLQISS